MYLLPTLKNPLNIKLITTELIFSPKINPSLIDTSIDLDLTALLVDGLRAASNRKAQITDPTISPRSWALQVLESVENLAPQEQWRALPVLAGIIQALEVDDPTPKAELVVKKADLDRFQRLFINSVNATFDFYSQLGLNVCQIPSTLIALSAVSSKLDDYYKRQLRTSTILPRVVDLIYTSTYGLNNGQLLRTVASDKDAKELNKALNENPVLVRLSSLSLLIQFLIQNSHPTRDFEIISTALQVISSYSILLSQEYQSLVKNIGADAAEQNHKVWRFLKTSLFSIAVSLQGYTSWLLEYLPKDLYQQNAVPIASTIIEAFAHIYFIVAQVSLSGFPTFDFVYFTCMDILLDPQFKLEGVSTTVTDLAAPFLAATTKSHSYKLIEGDLVTRGKLIFLLNIFELMTPLVPFHPWKDSKRNVVTISQVIMPLTKQFLTSPDQTKFTITPTYFQPVLESAHSVFLAIVSTPSQALEKNNGLLNGEIISDKSEASQQQSPESRHDVRETENFLDTELPGYLNTVLDLFPGVLSPNQFTLAITTIVRAFSPPSPMYNVSRSRSRWILEQIHDKARNKIEPGHPLPPMIGTHQQQINNTQDDHKDDKNIPIPTIRAVVVSALIHSLPYIEISLLEPWLNKVIRLVQNPTLDGKLKAGSALALEQQFLEADLFQMISEELEQYKSNVGIKWWFKARL